MKSPGYHIVPYSEEYHEQATQLEQGVIQGNTIQLEIIKTHFLDRARIFKSNYSCIALTDENEVIGSAIGAHTTILINGKELSAGIAFDAKVSASWRSKGIGLMLVKDIYKQFFQPQGISKVFMTAKQSNTPVVKLASNAVASIWKYEFIYLTIPTMTRVKKVPAIKETPQQLSVQLFKKEELSSEYYTQLDNGLAYFHTYKMYRLKIKKISWLYKKGILLLKTIKPSKYKSLPGENDTLSFATLYNHTPKNIHYINEVLESLETNGIKQLLVCCRHQDYIFNFLKKKSINQYSYNIVSDFNIDKNDIVEMDVRCL